MSHDFQLSVYLGIVFLIWSVYFIVKILRSPLRRIPGPFSSKFTRLPLQLATSRGAQLYYIHRLHQTYGHIVRISPNEVSVSSMADIREIHRIGSGFLKTEWYDVFTRGLIGVFNMRDPKEHAQRRKLFARPFSKSALRTSWEPVVKDKAQLAISQIQNEIAANGICDFLKWATFLATDISSHLMFGDSFDMLQKGKKNEYIRILEAYTQGSGIMMEVPFAKWILPYIPLRSFREMFSGDEILLQHGRESVAYSRKHSESCRNIFSGLVYESEKDDVSLSDTDVAMEASSLIIAGSDTTAITLTYLIWAVLSRPELRSDLETELATLGENWNESRLEALPLLNAIITETLRLYGAAPGLLPRTVPEGGVSFSGYYIPAGMIVGTQSWTVHRDPLLFPDPEKFEPERWLPGPKETSEAGRMALSPFGSGSRTCLGIHLSWMELRLIAAEFFLRCGNVKLAPSVTEESMKPKHFFLIAPSAHTCEIVST
ncbi:uncharacterized protein N7483_003740 [Penicillium malachiteum]|uniref:uncharacterized protein n=1 Tax=Penicillium malachiteum TaxID=1324776 RepID=UPI00254900B0|nr:uncharacterized protein N7483_003740 [Penicillium malachiteum]KAJ5729232.1 hypothetical protein N7483_003740 [Penicillium malachiteum]